MGEVSMICDMEHLGGGEEEGEEGGRRGWY